MTSYHSEITIICLLHDTIYEHEHKSFEVLLTNSNKNGKEDFDSIYYPLERLTAIIFYGLYRHTCIINKWIMLLFGIYIKKIFIE